MGSPYNWDQLVVKPALFLVEKMWPSECLVCHSEGPWLCAKCEGRLTAIVTSTCPFCKRISASGKTCKTCSSRFKLSGNLACWYYEEPLKSVIHRFKYKNTTAITEWFVEHLAENLKKRSKKFNLVTSVPSTPEKQHTRGFNQSELLAQAVAARLGLPYVRLLTRNDASHSQVGLTRTQRFTNVARQFSVNAKSTLNKETVLLIDDVITTGATLNACATALRAAGSGLVWAATLAKD